jgi:hypothetical protein
MQSQNARPGEIITSYFGPWQLCKSSERLFADQQIVTGKGRSRVILGKTRYAVPETPHRDRLRDIVRGIGRPVMLDDFVLRCQPADLQCIWRLRSICRREKERLRPLRNKNRQCRQKSFLITRPRPDRVVDGTGFFLRRRDQLGRWLAGRGRAVRARRDVASTR